MGLPHTGSNNIITISTSSLDFSIDARVAKKDILGISKDDYSIIKILSSSVKEIFISSLGEENLAAEGDTLEYIFKVPPLFFEQTDYKIKVKSKNGEPLEFRSNRSQIANKISRFSYDDSTRLSGMVNFGNSVGYVDFSVVSNGVNLLSLRIEVYPSKITYKTDYKDMMADINSIVSNSVLDFMKNTYHVFKSNNKKSNIPAEFFAVIQVIYKDYIKAINRIINVPNHKLITEHEVMPYYKVRAIDNRSISWISKHPETVRKQDGSIQAEKVLSVKKHTTYDTQENRLVRFMLESTIHKLEDFYDRYVISVKNPDNEITRSVKKMQTELRRLVNTTFLADVSKLNSTKSMSLVFNMAPGYRELYTYYLILQNGLTVGGDVFKLSYKDTAVLYEYWCFIKLYMILKQKYELKSPDIIQVNRKGVVIDLVKGEYSEIKFYNPKTKENIILSYNPKEQQTQTVNQKPDNVLELEKKGERVHYKYALDAKYRINSKELDETYPFDTPGPKLEDINTMHRYRDAIVYNNPESRFTFEKTMFGAYILFPYKNEDEYKNHKLYKSIEKVNIGGLPFLPSATSLVMDLLDDLISDSAETAFERTSLPAGIDAKLAEVDWKSRNVLVINIDSVEDLDNFIVGKYCDIPASIINSKSDIHYVAMYKSEKLFGDKSGIDYYGEIQVVPTLIKGASGELFFRFKVDDWIKLDRNIRAKEYGFNYMYTNMFLLQNSNEVPELFIKSDEEYRLYSELKRRMIDTEVSDDLLSPSLKIGDSIIQFNSDSIEFISEDGRAFECLNIDFKRKPGTAIKHIFNHLNTDK